MRHGGKILIDQLEIQGVSTVFTVPGESFLAALDGLHDSQRIRTIVCRQEGGAAMMAEAWGKMTGTPGICFVTRGPGAANSMSGLHIAQQDSTPMILFLGLHNSEHEDREAFQEIETKRLFSSFVKWCAVIRSTERIPEYVSRAFHVARSGRPGPVVLGLPENMLSAEAETPDAKSARPSIPAPAPADMTALQAALAKAQRPLMIVGGPGWSPVIQRTMEEFAARFDLPVAAAFRFQDYMDNRHRCYAGHAGIGIDGKLVEAIRGADVLIAIGARLGEMTTRAYTLIDIPNPKQFFVHVHPGGDELGTVYRADLPINATAGAFADALAALTPPASIPWSRWRADLRTAYEAAMRPNPTPGAVKLEEVVRVVSQTLPENAIVTNGAGNYT
ncbi:MAG: thiamine pyrophosphate-binding protein, partial [Hyphomicrobiaceae bacterium]